jgi:hypothetical protein
MTRKRGEKKFEKIFEFDLFWTPKIEDSPPKSSIQSRPRYTGQLGGIELCGSGI